MKLTSLELNSHISQKLGLKQFKMKGLEKIVVMTGVNGCGKTRLLVAVDWLLQQAHRSGYERVREKIERLNHPNSILKSGHEFYDDDPMSYHGNLQISTIEKELTDRVAGLELAFDNGESEEKSLKSYSQIADFLKRPLEHTQNHISRLSVGVPRELADLTRIGLLSSPLSYLNDICTRYIKEIESNPPEGDIENIASADLNIGEHLEKLKTLISKLLSFELEPTATGGNLNGISVSEITLSDGQAILLRWVVLIHSGLLRKACVPLLLDEPELHLHPDALNRLFDSLIENAPKCQIWVATHSISLISHLACLHPRSIWFGKDGEFLKAGKELPLVAEALLGGKNGQFELVDYCVSPEIFAFNTFATECLYPPITVNFVHNDPQILQACDFIQEHSEFPINILDFGAGQGRLLDGLAAEAKNREQCLLAIISYYAYEPEPKALALCTATISAHYTNSESRAFNSSQDICDSKLSFEFIALTNLLHEIHPIQWIEEIFHGDIINNCLNKQGKLLIIEDTLLGTGELAHNCGFIILEHAALEKLFKVTDDDLKSEKIVKKSSHQNRLQATQISKELCMRADTTSILSALELQLTTSISRIKTLRKKAAPLSYMDGRHHAYLAQLITNITLALGDMKQTPIQQQHCRS